MNTDPAAVLAAAQTILLIDWRSAAVPYRLATAGFEVLSANFAAGTAASYTAHDQDPSPVPEGASVYGPDRTGGGWLVLARLADLPRSADLVVAYRPGEELPGIATLAVNLGAAALWVEPDATSAEARTIAESKGLAYIEGTSILDAVGRPPA